MPLSLSLPPSASYSESLWYGVHGALFVWLASTASLMADLPPSSPHDPRQHQAHPKPLRLAGPAVPRSRQKKTQSETETIL